MKFVDNLQNLFVINWMIFENTAKQTIIKF